VPRSCRHRGAEDGVQLSPPDRHGDAVHGDEGVGAVAVPASQPVDHDDVVGVAVALVVGALLGCAIGVHADERRAPPARVAVRRITEIA
jgi:hypothetical protein